MTIVDRLNAIAEKLGADSKSKTVPQALAQIEDVLEKKGQKPATERTTKPKKAEKEKKEFTFSEE